MKRLMCYVEGEKGVGGRGRGRRRRRRRERERKKEREREREREREPVIQTDKTDRQTDRHFFFKPLKCIFWCENIAGDNTYQ